MSPIRFWYQVPSSSDPSGKNVVQKEGSIRIINIKHEPYEIQVNANGYGFHAIFGTQTNGHFLCIPDWNMGCELGPYDDRFWNIESIKRSGQIRHDEACAIGNALDLLNFMLGK